ncbi:MAG: RsbRD N-terminal domain-containing protein [bacterium]|nr:RsbRD N-terminal domain-containing protein [bacterium]
MKLNDILLADRKSIISRWLDLILNTYPVGAADILKREKNQFANPVGHTMAKGIEDIFDGILQGNELDKFSPVLDSIIRIRAVQEFTPSQAVSFIFLLKQAIREEVKAKNNGIFEELLSLESKIDNLAAISFDIFMQCREKVYEIKANEVRNMTSRFLESNCCSDSQED